MVMSLCLPLFSGSSISVNFRTIPYSPIDSVSQLQISQRSEKIVDTHPDLH